MDETRLFDSIECLYAASLDRVLWPDALRRAAELVGADAAALMSRGPEADSWHVVDAAGVPPDFASQYNARWSARDAFLVRAGFLQSTLTIRHLDAQALRSTPFAHVLCDSPGFQAGLLAGVSDRTGLALLFGRMDPAPFGADEEQQVERLWPHVVRAMAIRSRTAHAVDEPPAHWLTSVLDLWHIGLVCLSATGRHVYANRAARRLAASGDGFSLTPDGPAASSAAATRGLRDLLRELSDGRRPGPEWLRVIRPSGAPSYELALYRLPHAAEHGPAVAMMIAAADDPIACDAAALRRLHGLTDLEGSVAECLARAMHVQEIAATLDLSTQTARWYVQQVREKMGAASQSEVIRLLLRGLGAMVHGSSVPVQPNPVDNSLPPDTSHLRGVRAPRKH